MTRKEEEEESRCFRGCCTSGSVQLDVAMSEIKLAASNGGSSSNLVAQGAMSKVKRATYLGQDVAVKFPSLPTTDDLDRFHKELNIHLRLTLLGVENIVPVLGARAYPPNYVTIMPLAVCNLQQKIHERGPEDGGLPFVEALDYGLQIVRGLRAIHDEGYVHRDLKPANVLLTGEGKAQLTDFQLTEREDVLVELFSNPESRLGRAGKKPSGGFHKKLLVGTLEYMAPEILTKETHTRKSDVYSLGILLNEMLTGVFPFSDCTKERPGCHTVLEMGYGHQELKAAVATEGLRPTLMVTKGDDDAAAASDLVARTNRLLESCWQLDPSLRPSVDQVHAELEELRRRSNGLKPSRAPAPAPPRKKRAAVAAADEIMEEASSSPSRSLEQAIEEYVAKKEEGTPLIACSSGSFQTIGGRESQEDRVVEVHPHLFGVFDGHRGSEASEFCARHLKSVLAECMAAESGTSPGKALEECFRRLDEGFAQRHSQEGCNAGATACVALLCGREIFVANAGDCRCIVGSYNGEPVQLSTDHTTGNQNELGRIQRGALAFKFDTWRIGDAGLQVTRSIGDLDVKHLGVTSTPEVVRYDLGEDLDFLVLASDGLWDVLSNEEVRGLIRDTVKQPGMVGQRLAMEAYTRGSRDNVSVVVCFFSSGKNNGGGLAVEKIYEQGKLEVHPITQTFYGSRRDS